MKFMHTVAAATLALACLPPAAAAAMFDGSAPLLCAVTEIRECEAGLECLEVSPDAVNAPRFLQVDVEAGQITSTPERPVQATTAIERVEHLDGKLVLQGADDGLEEVRDGLGWTISVAEDTGRMVAAGVGDGVAFVMFGACTPR